VALRNKLFDWGLLPVNELDTPVISVGNLRVGGVGKTPMVEYLIRLLQKDFNVATLSRGYGRETKGFFIAQNKSTVAELGDEPLQYFKKFNAITVAVDEERVHGIGKLMEHSTSLNMILLDDAYQHRYVKPKINILISDYAHLYVDDHMMPSGRLREWASGSSRADIIIISKCPDNLSLEDQQDVRRRLDPLPRQQVYFTGIKYGELVPYTNVCNDLAKDDIMNFSVLLVSGIANPTPLFDYMKGKFNTVEQFKFKDHHYFNDRDIEEIHKRFMAIPGNNKLIITTEKDIMRLSLPPIIDKIQDLPLFYVPIEIFFHANKELEFNEQLLNYVKPN